MRILHTIDTEQITINRCLYYRCVYYTQFSLAEKNVILGEYSHTCIQWPPLFYHILFLTNENLTFTHNEESNFYLK
jgi:hypothetical protein